MRRSTDTLGVVPKASTVLWILAAFVFAYVLWKVGIGMIRSVTTPLPPPPPEGELRRINVRYRCSVCGVELRMTMAPEEDPPPPRHCLEDMDLLAPIME
jgi:hypothetical protein